MEKHEIPNWDEYFVKMSHLIKTKSKDRSTQVGAILVGEGHAVLGIGWNGFPRGINDGIESRHLRPAKYFYTAHAELNVITNAARHGIKTLGTTLYLSAGVNACADCARAIVQAGIAEIIGVDSPFEGKDPMWVNSCRIGREILLEAGVKVILLNSFYERL